MTWSNYFFLFGVVGSRYFLVATIAFTVMYVVRKKTVAQKKIQSKFPKLSDYQREILYSISSLCIMSVIPAFILFSPSAKPFSRIYTHVSDYGVPYLFISFALMYFMHDAYFYWAHRLMHHPKLFKYFHLVHHKSTNPSPWAAYAFHPLEALVEGGIFAILACAIPIYQLNFALFFLFQIIYNVYGHLGFELYPKKFNKHWLGRWLNTSVAHNQHHEHFNGNYGLYTLFWDRMFGTLREDYDARFSEVDNRR